MTTIDRCARAIAEVRGRYVIGCPVYGSFHIWDKCLKRVVSPVHHYEPDCQHWIDRQAAIACTEALLPVSDAVVESVAAEIKDETDIREDWDVRLAVCRAILTAAITHIVKEG